ncbi:hypothetical protein D3C72_1794370 [compost metagenome]
MHFDQLVNRLPSLAQLKVQLCEFVFIHPELMPAGFDWRRTAKPVVGVFDFVWFHDQTLKILFKHTVIEMRSSCEGSATN